MSQPDGTPSPAPAEGAEKTLDEAQEPAAAAEPAQPAQPDADERVGALEARVRELEAQLGERERELTERLARLQADFENFRRRSREEASAAQGRGKEALLKALLPVVDNLERALRHSEDEGLRLVARALEAALASQGIAVVDPEGEAFDARLHEAIAQESREGAKAGSVLAVVEKGYQLDGRVVRPARVVVAA